MSLDNDVDQAVAAGEQQSAISNAQFLSDRGAILVGRYWNDLGACGVPDDLRRELALQVAELYWVKTIGVPPCGCEPGSDEVV
jgi:hypothetical protein